MGQARRRGLYEKRKAEAIKKNKSLLVQALGGGLDADVADALRSGIVPFLNLIPDSDQASRRKNIIDYLETVHVGPKLEEANSIRYREDEIFWYLFLCEQALDDPLCIDLSQAARILPFFVGIGDRWKYHQNIKGLENKLKEIVGVERANPDGLIFEVLVALSYASTGWDVELLQAKPPQKSPDLLVTKGDQRFFVECKRQSRRSDYAEKERNEFLRRWDNVAELLMKNKQWLWFKCEFHCEVSTLPDDFFVSVFSQNLPLKESEKEIYNGIEATIFAKEINSSRVQEQLKYSRIKQNSPTLIALLTDDQLLSPSQTSIKMVTKNSFITGCEIFALGSYINEINWACGMTRTFTSEISISKKARDGKNLLVDAVKQVPSDTPSIIHIAFETLEGDEVELKRTQKILASIPGFVTGKPVQCVRIHRFQPNISVDHIYDFDETIESYEHNVDAIPGLPKAVVLPTNIELRKGAHWNK